MKRNVSKLHDDLATMAGNRDVVVAYLSYALEEVDEVSSTASYFLKMCIEALSFDARPANAVEHSASDPYH